MGRLKFLNNLYKQFNLEPEHQPKLPIFNLFVTKCKKNEHVLSLPHGNVKKGHITGTNEQ